jgi:hypothetical protein
MGRPPLATIGIDGSALCIYECGMIDRMTDTASVTVARFDLDWLTGS